MIQSVFSDSLVLFLMIYAILDIFMHLAEKLLADACKDNAAGYRVLFLDADCEVERRVRRAMMFTDPDCISVILVDNGLSNQQRLVAHLLCGEYDNLCFYSKEQYLYMVEHYGESIVAPPNTRSPS